MSPLPTPARSRWQPLRLGLVDLFYYDREEFGFRDGRLLLRGNNGTGKSKVLALTLPFLLDGDLSAHRVEPDADPSKRMEWNLLLGGEHPHEERLGYAWLEFGRLGDDRPDWCTVGCGMKATRGRGITGHWFFLTDGRVGEDLSLVDATGVALTPDRLEEALGARGCVYRRARDYRRALDERLFGLGDVRYAALIDLLIRIRAPQLSKRPDERGLSAALTGSLPPLDQALITDVAEAFRALEEDADQLAAMVEARGAADRYLQTYRAYARMVSRRRAAPLRQVQTVFDRVSRELTEAEAEHARARVELAQARGTLDELRAEHARLRARQETLQDEPAARSARELRRAGEEAEQAGRRCADAAAAVEALKLRLERLRQRLSDAGREEDEAREGLEATRATALQSADGARVRVPLAQALEEEPDLAVLRGRADALVSRQHSALDRVRRLARRWEDAHDALAHARAGTEQLVSEQAETSTRRDAASRVVGTTAARYVRDVGEHLARVNELALADAAASFAAAEAWLQTLSGANPLEQALATAGREAARSIERARVEQQALGEAARTALEQLEREIQELESGGGTAPPVPHTRSADRADRDGAPLWKLVDFQDGLPDGDRAGLEAALEAAGILDAWVTPSGELLDPDTADSVIAPVDPAHGGPRLDGALVPAVADGTAVAEGVVRRVLAAIGLGESDGPVWVSASGRFRNGVLRGAWRKPAATYIGHSAREAARRARLAELHGQAQAVRAELAAIQQELIRLRDRQAQLERELDELPSDALVRDAHGALRAVEAELLAATERLWRARVREQQARREEQAAREALELDAADLGLPTAADELAEVEAALARLRETLAALWPGVARHARATEAFAQLADDVSAAESEVADAGRRLVEAEQLLGAAVERRDTLKATAGAAIAELERRLAEVASRLAANTNAQGGTEQRLSDADRADASAESRATELRRQLDDIGAERFGAVEALRRFATTGLIRVALPDLEVLDTGGEWTITAALRLAREIEQALSAEADDDPRWQRLQRQVTDELGALADALRRHGNNASATFSEDGIVVEVTFRARTTSLPELAAALADEVLERERLLDAREREILENHLVGEVASSLQELIVAAEKRVAETNRELAERPTTTGMRLRLRWVPDPDGPDGLADARARLLRQRSDAWSEEDRAAVGSFLQSQIRAVRAQDAAGNWLEHLTQALDYRGWHRFTVERWQNGSWRSAAGPSSGGERVLAASLPLFAAASSYYSSAANPHAPRLVMLDEAFAGVDDRARAKCLGLLSAFDLDVVMTSEREWGCYAEVPGLAIAQLSRIDGVAAVLVSRWEWDGVARTAVAAPTEAALAGAAPPEGPQLWDASTSSG